jgi:hypothetical protein
VLGYELNILLGKDLGGGMSLSEKYVFANPVADEISDAKYKLSGTLTPPTPIANGISDVKSSGARILVYPNPVSEFVTIDIESSNQNEIAVYKLINMEGKVLIGKTIEIVSGKYTENIPVATIASGVYTVLVFTNGEVVSKKIIKK